MAEGRQGNVRLTAVLAEANLSHAQVARALVRVAAENDAHELVNVGRSHVSHWVAGAKPSGRAPDLLREALSRLLHRSVTLEELGLAEHGMALGGPTWEANTLTALADLGRIALDAD